MDNASKALIMAGAILISVAIVGIGIYIFSVANNMTGSAVDRMNSLEVQSFNADFYSYADDNESILGSRARDLVKHAKSVGFTDDVLEVPETFNNRLKYTVVYSYDDNKGSGSGYINGVTITQTPAKSSTGTGTGTDS